jgi:hypothetical protein
MTKAGLQEFGLPMGWCFSMKSTVKSTSIIESPVLLGRCWSSELYNPCPGVMEGAPWQRNLTRTTWRITLTTSSYQSSLVAVHLHFCWL